MVRKYTTANMAEIVDNVRPFTIGFDRLFDNLHNVSEIHSPNYPPYNIIADDDEHFTIEIACAGFAKDEFNVHLLPDGNKLIVQGVQDRGEDTRKFYHKGIGARNFTHSFALANDVEVVDSVYYDGILEITLRRVVPEEMKPKQIEVK